MAAWDGSTKTAPSGDGSEGNPYKIATEANLAWLAEQVNNDNNNEYKTFVGEYFIQTADLDLGNNNWNPMGKSNKRYFAGTYDGGGYVISNLSYNNNTQSNVGLFGYINGATLTKITVASGSIYGAGAVGGICGYAVNSTISFCTNVATIYGKMEQNGGICGYMENSTITDCINYGLVSGSNFTGGVLGRCKDNNGKTPPTNYDNYVINCVNVGQVFSFCATSGNIIGFNDNLAATITNCYYDNQINALGGVTSTKTAMESVPDQSGKFEGKATTTMIGNGLKSALGNDNWVYADGMYPRLSVNSGKPAVTLAATPVTLASGDKADNVTKNFTVSTDNNVTWTSGNNAYLTISGNNASIQKSTGLVLTATKDGYSKKVYLKSNKSGATAIGSSTSPLTIEDESELKAFRDAVNNYGVYKGCANYDGFKGVHFKVTVDIELTDWTEPIGVHNSFKGVFDGNHRTISNITINQTSVSNIGGLFGCASFGSIENLSIKGSVKGAQSVGGLCGLTFSETIKNCETDCTVSTTGEKTQCGGIVGVDKGYSKITKCKNLGTVSSFRYMGGIIGRCNHNAQISECINKGNITSTSTKTADDIGGICGNIANNNCEFSNCENYGAISLNLKNGGGIVGSLDTGFEGCSITNCINSGDITGPAIGGIIGQNSGTITIDKCLNIGSVTGGNGIGNGTSVSNCFNAGNANNAIAVSGVTNCINVGDVTTVPAGCFYDNQLFSGSGAGSGLKTSQMVGTALQETLGTENWTYTDNMYPMIKTLENSEYMIMAATTIVLDAADELNDVKTKFHISTPHAVEWECDPISVVAFSGNNAYLAKTTLDQPAVVTASLGKLKKTFDLTIKAGESLLQPDIVWNIPQTDFTYGDKLTTAMQNATESHGYEGHFEFNFDENHALSVGGHNLTATFIPNDEAQIAIKVASNAITVSKAKPTINWSVENGLEIYYGTDADEILKTAKATLNGENVSDEGEFFYQIPVLTGGSKEIKVKFIGDNYESDEVTRNIIVTPATPTIAWATPAAIDYGTALSDLQLGAVSGVEGTFEYKINDEVVTADMNKILDAGTYTIVAKFTPQTSNYSTVDDIERTLVVNPIQPTVTWANPDAITYGTAISATQLNAEVESEYATLGTITYSEGTTSITDGMVLDVVEGGHIITATFTPKSEYAQNYNSATTTAKITINKAPANVQWSENLDAIIYGEKLSDTQLCATSDATGVEFTYTVTIDGNSVNAMGAILPAGDERVINAVLPESNNYSGWNGYRTIKVNPSPTTITWDDPEDIFYGTLLSDEQLNATATAIINGETVTVDGVWTYEPGKNTKLNASDTPQELTVKFTSTDNNFKSVEETKAYITVKKATPEIEWEDQQHLTYGASTEGIENTLKNATAKFDGVTLTGDYEYTLPLTTDLQAGADNITASVEFNPTGEDANNFESANAVINIVVDKADPTITWVIADEDKTFTYGFGLSDKQLNAISDGVGEIVYKEGENVLAIDAILDAGTHTITATLPESDNYNETAATATIVVNQAETSIEWNTPAAIAYGTPISGVELNAKANVEGSFAYTLNGEEAKGQTPNVGSHSITATFTPSSANYKESTATVTLQVVSTAAEITWTAPAAITYGTALSSAQLNASSEIDGTFIYSPAEGAILPVGDSTLSVVFIPTSTDYGRATGTVKLTVNKATLSVSVADITVNQGDDMPQFNIDYKGFVNNENESSLTTAPTATCTASTDKAGTFDIVVSGGASDNYNFEYKNGKLTVVAKEDTTAITGTEVKISVYPNPTADVFFVETDSETDFIYVYNMAGKLVATEANIGKTRIDLSDEPQGTYFVKVGEKTLKVLKF